MSIDKDKIKHISKLARISVNEKKIDGITAFRDESDRDGMRIVVEVRRGENAEGILNQKDDPRLDIIVPQVSDLAKRYCGTSFIDHYSSSKTEEFSIHDGFTSTIIVSESPIVAVSSVQERTTYADAYETLSTSDYEYYVDTSADAIVRTDNNGRKKAFPQGVASVKVTYTAG